MITSHDPFLAALPRLPFPETQEIAPEALARLVPALREQGLSGLLKENPSLIEGLDPRHILALSLAYRRFASWRQELQKAISQWQAQGLGSPPEDILLTSEDQIWAIERGLRLCGPTWEGLRACLAMWDGAIGVATKVGQVRASLRETSAEGIQPYEDHVGRAESLASLPSHRWFAMVRGEREGVLRLEFLPLEGPWDEALLGQARVHREALLPWAGERSEASLLGELVLVDLVPSLRSRITARATVEGALEAALAYLGLLETPPVEAPSVAALFLGKRKNLAGAVIVGRRGEVRESKMFKVGQPWMESLLDWLASHGTDTLALPAQSSGPDDPLVQLRRKASGKLTILTVRTAALAEARRLINERGMGVEEASALVLARRAIRPAEEWALVDPLSMGLGAYPSELDQKELLAVLEDARALASLKRANRTCQPRAAVAGSWLNPLVKTLNDLRPGMLLAGVITNVSSFGAFVNLGLPWDGLIHISELSNDFVRDPSAVVQPGQQVKVKVLTVDQDRERISLTMRESDRPRGPRSAKSKALDNLERLFKK